MATSMKLGPANESVQVAVVGSIWSFGDKTDGTVIDCIQFVEYRPYTTGMTKHLFVLL